MSEDELAPIAAIMVSSYLETGSYSRQFLEEYGFPVTTMARVHHLRAVTMSQVEKTEGLTLSPTYVEFGRVEITVEASGTSYVLQGASSLGIEQRRLARQESLFDNLQYLQAEAKMLVYAFGPTGLTLSVAGAMRKSGSRRLYATGEPTFIATWSYDSATPSPFDQGPASAFEGLGSLDIDAEDELPS